MLTTGYFVKFHSRSETSQSSLWTNIDKLIQSLCIKLTTKHSNNVIPE